MVYSFGWMNMVDIDYIVELILESFRYFSQFLVIEMLGIMFLENYQLLPHFNLGSVSAVINTILPTVSITKCHPSHAPDDNKRAADRKRGKKHSANTITHEVFKCTSHSSISDERPPKGRALFFTHATLLYTHVRECVAYYKHIYATQLRVECAVARRA